MKYMNAARKYGYKIGGVVAGVLGAQQMAGAVDDFTVITAAVSVAGVSVALISMGALKAAPNVTGWASRKLAGFIR